MRWPHVDETAATNTCKSLPVTSLFLLQTSMAIGGHSFVCTWLSQCWTPGLSVMYRSQLAAIYYIYIPYKYNKTTQLMWTMAENIWKLHFNTSRLEDRDTRKQKEEEQRKGRHNHLIRAILKTGNKLVKSNNLQDDIDQNRKDMVWSSLCTELYTQHIIK